MVSGRKEPLMTSSTTRGVTVSIPPSAVRRESDFNAQPTTIASERRTMSRSVGTTNVAALETAGRIARARTRRLRILASDFQGSRHQENAIMRKLALAITLFTTLFAASPQAQQS